MNCAFKVSFITSLVLFLYSCGDKTKSERIDKRCPELVLKAEKENARTANGTKEGPNGISVRVEYEDTVYRVIQFIDETRIPADRIRMAFENIEQDMIASISSSIGSERREFEQAVKYRVTFEHTVVSKETGRVIVRNIMTPDEMADALKSQLSPSDELGIITATLKSKLPRVIESGYTMTDIKYHDGIVDVKIVVDENLLNFDIATQISNWSKELQALTLADLTVGLTFWSKAAKASAGFFFYYVGSKGENYLPIRFSKDEVIKFNDIMDRIKREQFK